MTERGRGSEPVDDETGGEDTRPESAASDYPVPPTAARPIAPYDPYRPPTGDPRLSRRNVAAEDYDPHLRRSPRGTARDPFLPDDDPLNAEAWQLELGDPADSGDNKERLPEFDPDSDPDPDRAAPQPHRPRRQPPAMRTRREPGAARTARRSRTAAPSARGGPRPAVTLGVPRVVSGSSLASDQTVLALLGINAASIVIMALLLGIRLGGLPSPMVLQLNAAGNPALWGPPAILWRLPLMVLFLTLMFLVVAWFIHPINRFAARFAMAAAAVVQLIAWAAVILHFA